MTLLRRTFKLHAHPQAFRSDRNPVRYAWKNQDCIRFVLVLSDIYLVDMLLYRIKSHKDRRTREHLYCMHKCQDTVCWVSTPDIHYVQSWCTFTYTTYTFLRFWSNNGNDKFQVDNYKVITLCDRIISYFSSGRRCKKESRVPPAEAAKMVVKSPPKKSRSLLPHCCV